MPEAGRGVPKRGGGPRGADGRIAGTLGWHGRAPSWARGRRVRPLVAAQVIRRLTLKVFAPMPDVSAQELDGRMVVQHHGSDQSHQLNEAASYIWSLVDGKTPSDAIATHLFERFDIDQETALADTEETLAQLCRLGLVVAV